MGVWALAVGTKTVPKNCTKLRAVLKLSEVENGIILYRIKRKSPESLNQYVLIETLNTSIKQKMVKMAISTNLSFIMIRFLLEMPIPNCIP